MSSTSYQDFNHLFCEYKLQHEILTEEIRSVVACEKIFLLAATFTSHHVANLFLSRSISPKCISHYHVLVVVPRADKSPNMEVQDKIEGRLQHVIPSTAIVLDTEQFNNWVKQKHPFAIQIENGVSLLYGQRENVVENPEQSNLKELRINFESMFAQGRNKAQEFLAGADLFRIRGQNKMAAFMLHQSLEQMLRSLLYVLTGLEIATHNLDKLLRFSAMSYCRLSEIFKSNDGKSEKSFQLLQRAYIDARYSNDYHINTVDLILLKEKIETIQNICEKMVKDLVVDVIV